MNANYTITSATDAADVAEQIKLKEGEQLLLSRTTMTRWQALLWIVLLLGSSGTGLAVALVAAYFVPGGEQLGWYDRVLRLVLEVNVLLFGRRQVHLTNRRLIIDQPDRIEQSISLGDVRATDTRLFCLGGNLLVHIQAGERKRLGIWAIEREAAAGKIREACQQRVSGRPARGTRSK